MVVVVVKCRSCGQIVPGVASEGHTVAAVHTQLNSGLRCPGSNCPGKKTIEKKGEEAE